MNLNELNENEQINRPQFDLLLVAAVGEPNNYHSIILHALHSAPGKD